MGAPATPFWLNSIHIPHPLQHQRQPPAQQPEPESFALALVSRLSTLCGTTPPQYQPPASGLCSCSAPPSIYTGQHIATLTPLLFAD